MLLLLELEVLKLAKSLFVQNLLLRTQSLLKATSKRVIAANKNTFLNLVSIVAWLVLT